MSRMKNLLNKKTQIKILKLKPSTHRVDLSRWQLFIFVFIFGGLGTYLLLFSSAATTVLLSEDFATSINNFTVQKGGTWTITSGQYALTSPATTSAVINSNLSVHNTSVPAGDFTLTADAKAVGTTSNYDDFSVVFSFTDPNNYYYANFNETNGTSTNGVFKVVNGNATEIKDFSGLSTGGTMYGVKIEKVGTTFNIYRSSSLVGTFTDTNAGSGKVGFGAYNNAATFDNLVVTVPTQDAGPSSIINLNPVADSYINSQSPSTNYGASTNSRVDSSPIFKQFMRFDLSSLAGQSVSSAKLRVYVTNTSVDSQGLKSVDNTWSESGITYANQPTLGTSIGTVSAASSTGWKEVDLTSYVKSKVGQLTSFVMEGNGPKGDSLQFYSKENSTNKPQLVVTVSTSELPPPPPPPPAACSDGLDNDTDGKIDYPADPGCINTTDNDETNDLSQPTDPGGTGGTAASYTCTKTLAVGGNVSTFVNSLSSGQIGCLAAGTHNANGVTITKSGITIASAPGVRANVLLTDTEWRIYSSDGASNVTIKRINFAGSTDEIFKVGAVGVRFEDNEFTNNKTTIPGACIYLGGSQNMVITRNIFKDCGDPAGSADHRNHAIYAADYDGLTVTDNLFYGGGSYRVNNYGTSQKNAYIAHNIFDGTGSQRGGINSNGTTSSGHVIERNILVNTVNQPAIGTSNGGSISKANYNCFYNNSAGTIVKGSDGGPIAEQIGNITANPLFVNAGAGDYHMQASSQCLSLVGYDIYTKILANR
jgi:hypothetical protein